MTDDLWAEIQSAIDFGYATAACILGPVYAVYRANGPSDPLAVANLVTSTPAAFASSPNKFNKPNLYASPIWYPQVDPTVVQGGDYLVGPAGTFFMHPQQPLLPPSCVGCNDTLSVLRPTAGSGTGIRQPGGDQVKQEVPALTGWPGSLLQGTKGEKPDDNLPNDARAAWMSILLPQTPGVEILPDDVVNDSNGHRYIVSSVELSPLGWRLTAAYADA